MSDIPPRILVLLTAIAQAIGPIFLNPFRDGGDAVRAGEASRIEPAEYAFAIWGPIYVAAVAYAIRCATRARHSAGWCAEKVRPCAAPSMRRAARDFQKCPQRTDRLIPTTDSSCALPVNGHTESVRGYHYHVTPGRFPYIIGGYAGVPEPANIRGHRGLETGAIEDNSSGESSQPKVIAAVRPANGKPGTKQKLEIELDPSQATRARVPEGTPDWVQVGPFEAVSIERAGNVLHVEIQIPDDATLGVLMDCHIEFKAANRPRAVFKRNDVFRVVEVEDP